MVLRSGPEAFGYTFVKPDEDDTAVAPDDNAAAAPAATEGAEHTEDDIETGVDGVAVAVTGAGGGDAAGVIRSSSAATTDHQQVVVKSTKTEDKTAKVEDDKGQEKPYVYIPSSSSYYKSKMPGNLPDTGDGGGGAAAAGAVEMNACLCGFCCCLTILLVVTGSILFATQAYLKSDSLEEEEPEETTSTTTATRMSFAAVICMILGGGTCLFACCSCITSCVALSSLVTPGGGNGDMGGGGGGPWEDAQKEARVSMKRQNDRYDKAEQLLDSVHYNAVTKDVKGISEAEKKEARQKKEEEKRKKTELEAQVKKDLEAGLTVKDIRRNYRPIAFVIRFNGDVMLHDAAELLRKQVSIIVNCARPGRDQAVVVLTSPGGAVSSYGLAASQLIRLRKAGIKLVACVDTVAASGGYMMAAVADLIYAAPFSVIGSIGVVTQIPNVQRFLNKHDIDAYLFTAGKHKRTIDIIGDVTEEGKAKLQEELDEIHRAFKDHIALARPKVRATIDDVATGEYWLAVHAKEKGLVDDILTSDEYLESISKENEIIELVEKKKKATVLSGLLGPGGFAAQSIKDLVLNSFFGAATSAATSSSTNVGPPTTPMAIA